MNLSTSPIYFVSAPLNPESEKRSGVEIDVEPDNEIGPGGSGENLADLLREWIWVKTQVSIAVIGERGVGKSFLINSLLDATFQDTHVADDTKTKKMAIQKSLSSASVATTRTAILPSTPKGNNSSLDKGFLLVYDTLEKNSDKNSPKLDQIHITEAVMDDDFAQFVNWSSEKDAKNNVINYCKSTQFNNTMSDRYSFLLPQGPFKQGNMAYTLSFGKVPELQVCFISEVQLRFFLWQVHIEAQSQPLLSNHLKRQYRLILNLPREQVVPLPGVTSMDHLPIPTDIKKYLGKSLVFKGKGQDLALDRIYVREKLLETLTQFGNMIDSITVRVPCGVLKGNRQIMIQDVGEDTHHIKKPKLRMDDVNLMIVGNIPVVLQSNSIALGRNGITHDIYQVLKESNFLDKLTKYREEHKLLFVYDIEMEDIQGYSSGPRMLYFRNQEQMASLKQLLSNQLKHFLASEHAPVPVDVASLLDLTQVLFLKPLLYASLCLQAPSITIEGRGASHFKHKTNVPALLASIQNISLSKFSQPLKDFDSNFNTKHRNSTNNTGILTRLSNLFSGGKKLPLILMPHFNQKMETFKLQLRTLHEALRTRLSEKLRETNKMICSGTGTLDNYVGFVPQLWSKVLLAKVKALTNELVRYASDLLTECSQHVELPPGSTPRDKQRLAQILKVPYFMSALISQFCTTSAEKTIRKKFEMLERFITEANVEDIARECALDHIQSTVVYAKSYPTLGQKCVDILLGKAAENIEYGVGQIEAIQKILDDSMCCLMRSPQMRASQVMNFLICSHMQEKNQNRLNTLPSSSSSQQSDLDQLLSMDFRQRSHGVSAHPLDMPKSSISSEKNYEVYSDALWFKFFSRPQQSSQNNALEQQLKNNSLTAVPVVDDSNCQFRSLSYLVYGAEEGHSVMRLLLLNELLSNPARYASLFARRDIDLDEYVCVMCQDGVKGDMISLHAFSNFYNANVYLYSPFLPKPILIQPADSNKASREAFGLVYAQNDMYQPIVELPAASLASDDLNNNNTNDTISNPRKANLKRLRNVDVDLELDLMNELRIQDSTNSDENSRPLKALRTSIPTANLGEDDMMVEEPASTTPIVKRASIQIPSLIDMSLDTLTRYSAYLPNLEGGLPEELIHRFLNKLIETNTLNDDLLVKILSPTMHSLTLNQWKQLTGVSCLEISKICPSLQSFSLANCSGLMSHGLSPLLPVTGPRLLHINLEGCYLIESSTLHEISTHCPLLQTIKLNHCSKITDEGVATLLQRCKQLTSLLVVNCLNLTGSCFASIPQDSNLSILDFTDCVEITEKDLTVLVQKCKRIQSLKVSGKNVTDQVIQMLALTSPQLRQLSVTCGEALTDAAIQALSGCSRLTSLTLTSCKNITDNAFDNSPSTNNSNDNLLVPKTSHRNSFGSMDTNQLGWKSLEELDLSRCLNVGPATASLITERCYRLQMLSLHSCEEVTEQSLLLIASNLKYLRSVNLSGCNSVSDQVIIKLAKNCQDLSRLLLFNCHKITDASLAELANSSCSRKLEELNLSSCENITDQGVKHIASSCHGLRTLFMEECKITDEGILAVSCGLRSLESLSVAYNKEITDGAIQFLAYCSNLTTLDLSYSRNVSIPAVNAGLKSWPKLRTLNLRGFSNFVSDSLVHPTLQVLNLSWCKNLTDVALHGIVEGCPMLESLHLAWCTKITSNSVHVLGKRAQYLQVLNIRGCHLVSLLMLKFLAEQGKLIFK